MGSVKDYFFFEKKSNAGQHFFPCLQWEQASLP